MVGPYLHQLDVGRDEDQLARPRQAAAHETAQSVHRHQQGGVPVGTAVVLDDAFAVEVHQGGQQPASLDEFAPDDRQSRADPTAGLGQKASVH